MTCSSDSYDSYRFYLWSVVVIETHATHNYEKYALLVANTINENASLTDDCYLQRKIMGPKLFFKKGYIFAKCDINYKQKHKRFCTFGQIREILINF